MAASVLQGQGSRLVGPSLGTARPLERSEGLVGVLHRAGRPGDRKLPRRGRVVGPARCGPPVAPCPRASGPGPEQVRKTSRPAQPATLWVLNGRHARCGDPLTSFLMTSS